MDPEKWKSVAISKEAHELAKKQADENYRSISQQITYLIEKESKKSS